MRNFIDAEAKSDLDYIYNHITAEEDSHSREEMKKLVKEVIEKVLDICKRNAAKKNKEKQQG